ncbi:ABC transporter permease [Fibrobacter sp. UWEL]|uniref:ABC transporter permease n=1 Tax=Fibrobacter sp. UWEL TaxID=1896209 RepID=UPI0009123764|nr:ABC transporter permease [Fibrobacter sp. UWEL]SHL50897.1 lipopolysaccharide transport system permease protein [Fibrobacter sp. UWEL]
MSELNSEKWITEIKPKSSLLSIDFKELWQYRDLYRMFVKRDIVTWYKQTILGPLWFFIQPIMTTIMFMVVFGGIAKISTDGLPQPLFYLAGICLWTYFAECLNQTSKTFIDNANVFGKVYFPRLVVPMATVTSNLIRLSIQMGLFLIVFAYYLIFTDAPVHPNLYLLLTPVLITILAGLALGFGILFSSLTTKYRDLTFLLSFIVQLWMYATPVIYPLSTIDNPKLKMLMSANPLTSIMETFKYGMLGVGEFSWQGLGYSTGFAIVLLTIGIIVFNRIQKTFMDTV